MKTFGRVVVAASAAVAFTAGSALVAPVVGAQSFGSIDLGSAGGDNCGEQVVTSVNADGADWGTPPDENAAKIAAAPESAPDELGNGVLSFVTDVSGTSLYKNANKMPLADIIGEDDKPIALSYEYTSSGQAPALQIRLNDANIVGDNSGVGFATIVWSPAAVTDGTWETAAPASDAKEFWLSKSIEGATDGEGTQANKTTLARIVELNKDAKIVAYGVQQTRENASTGVAVDNFTFGCETTNFELEPEDDAPAESPSGIFGSLTGSLS